MSLIKYFSNLVIFSYIQILPIGREAHVFHAKQLSFITKYGKEVFLEIAIRGNGAFHRRIEKNLFSIQKCNESA